MSSFIEWIRREFFYCGIPDISRETSFGDIFCKVLSFAQIVFESWAAQAGTTYMFFERMYNL